MLGLIGPGPLQKQDYGGARAPTICLLHMDGANGGTTFTDSGPSGRTCTANGNAQTSTAQSRFGGSSALFDGSGDYVSMPDSSDWAFGADPFTIEAWIRPTSLAAAASALCGQATNNQNAFGFYVSSTGELYLQKVISNVVQTVTTSAGVITTNVWNHVAFVRNGTDYRLYVNGRSAGQATLTNNWGDYTGVFAVGAEIQGPWYFTGYIDEFRVSRNARWTAPFTPPIRSY